ncbi:Uncharacterized protein SCF082_LOCUS26372 [Durusdinium trenchii]|uniref:Uncharacterized protein n=1 Tax=Durusdinium trenchii TaxID=1381693 RepID=A0ABP0M868_9DINO
MANGQGENPEPVEEAEQKGPFGKQKAKHGNFAGFSDHEKKVYEVTISSIEGVVGGVGGESRAVTALDDVLAALMYAAWHVECARSATDAPIRSMSKMSEIQEWFQKALPEFANTVSFCIAIWLKFIFAGSATVNGKECRAWSALRSELQTVLCKSQEQFVFDSSQSIDKTTGLTEGSSKKRRKRAGAGGTTENTEVVNALELADLLLKLFVSGPVTQVAVGDDDEEDESTKAKHRVASWMKRADVVTPCAAYIKDMNLSMTLHTAPRAALEALAKCPSRVNMSLLDGLAIIFTRLEVFGSTENLERFLSIRVRYLFSILNEAIENLPDFKFDILPEKREMLLKCSQHLAMGGKAAASGEGNGDSTVEPETNVSKDGSNGGPSAASSSTAPAATVDISEIMTLEKVNNYHDSLPSLFDDSRLAHRLGLKDMCAAGLKAFERKLEIALWQEATEMTFGGSHVLINLIDKKDQVKVKVPLPSMMQLPYVGPVVQQKPRNGAHVKLCEVFGLSFWTSSPGTDVVSQDVAVPAWACKSVTKADQAYFREIKKKFYVEVSLPAGSPQSLLYVNVRFSSGRLVCNVDSTSENVFVTASELGLCGRPLSTDDDITLPLSKDMLLPESLDPEADLKQAERQRPSNEACQAQKGTKRWMALLRSLLTVNGENMKHKPCIVLNLTGYIEDVGCAVFEMRLANQELKGGFTTDQLYYHSVQWISKDLFGQARLTRDITDGWTQRRFEHGGHRFSMDAPKLSEQEIASIPGAGARMGNLDTLQFEVLERLGDRMLIKTDEHKFWSAQTGALLTEYEGLRQRHLDLVGQSSVVAASSTSESAAPQTEQEPTPATVEVESIAKLQEDPGIEHRVPSECPQVELILCKDKSVWLVSSQGKSVGKHVVLGGFGTGQWLAEAECSEPGIPFALPHGDKSLFQLDETSFSSEAQGCTTMTLYKMLIRAETEKNITSHRVSFLEVKRKAAVQAGEDGFEVSIKAPMTFRCLRDPRSFAEGASERVTSKNLFSKCVGPTLPRNLALTVCRYRFERVGQNFKIQRPYMITGRALTLQKDKPLKLT